MQQCWSTTPNIVGCYMLCPFAHPFACCWELFRSFVRSNVAGGGHLGLIVIYLFKAYASTTTEAPSTSIGFYLKTEIFLSGLAYRQHVSVENGHRKRIFSTRSRMNIFENALYTQMTWYHNQQMD